MYYQGNSRAIDSRLLDLTYTHSGDVIISDVRRLSFYSPEKVIRFGLSVIPSFCLLFRLSFRPSVIISFPLNILRTA